MHAGGGDAGNAGEPASPGGESFGGGMGGVGWALFSLAPADTSFPAVTASRTKPPLGHLLLFADPGSTAAFL